jgi:hypothetical protein
MQRNRTRRLDVAGQRSASTASLAYDDSLAHVSVGCLVKLPASHPSYMSVGITQSLGHLHVLSMCTLQHTVSCEGVASINAHVK